MPERDAASWAPSSALRGLKHLLRGGTSLACFRSHGASEGSRRRPQRRADGKLAEATDVARSARGPTVESRVANYLSRTRIQHDWLCLRGGAHVAMDWGFDLCVDQHRHILPAAQRAALRGRSAPQIPPRDLRPRNEAPAELLEKQATEAARSVIYLEQKLAEVEQAEMKSCESPRKTRTLIDRHQERIAALERRARRNQRRRRLEDLGSPRESGTSTRDRDASTGLAGSGAASGAARPGRGEGEAPRKGTS